jgi:hypothetical protein
MTGLVWSSRWELQQTRDRQPYGTISLFCFGGPVGTSASSKRLVLLSQVIDQHFPKPVSAASCLLRGTV